MKLFDGYEAVRFPEENLIFVTHNGYLYYVYNPKYNSWRKHRSAGNDHITVCNYPDISRDELEAAMQGVFPEKETDFMRLCDPAQLCIRDMLDLLKVDYASHMSNCDIYHTVHRFLLKSNIRYKAFEDISKLLGCAAVGRYNTQKIIDDLKDTCFRMLGRDIFKKEIGIPIHEYLNQYRISKSLSLLKTHTVTEVGYVCGFCDNSHFISIFKKYIGTTPMQYKKQHR